MSSALTTIGSSDVAPNFFMASERVASGLTGYMYIESGMADWTFFVSIHSTKALPPAGFDAPARTPAYST